MKIPRLLILDGRAFSLAEVIIAIGIVAFCVLMLVGLLPVGLQTIKSSREEAGAANCLEQLANSLRSARTNASGQFQITGVYSNLSWTSPNLLSNLSVGGVPTTSANDQRLTARVEIKTQPTLTSPGAALVSVAWPSSAKWIGQGKNLWTNAQGSVTSWVIFLPEP